MNINDWRNIENGREIPTESYSDQPYVVKTDDCAWLCCITTGAGNEGESGQHVITMRSCDRGRSWSEPVDVEPADGPESSYAVLLKVQSGRIYCFYNHNSDNLRQVKADNPPYENGFCYRVDSLGYFVFKYSDDHGRTWSAQRYRIPVREMEIDRNNPYGGKVRFFWNVGRAFSYNSCGYVPLIKVGGFGEGFFTSTEGVLLKSQNIMSEDDPEKIIWETLPDGDRGIRPPVNGGPIASEHSFSELSEGTLFDVFRTVDGHPGCTYSRDGGRSWEPTRYMCYADGRMMKHPRAANFAWKCANGKYLYWFHNHGGKDFEGRNPVWLCGGIEADSSTGKVIKWSQPEIVLYDDDTFITMSYPDLIEDGGRYYLTETQKNKARLHEIPVAFLEKLWCQADSNGVDRDGILIEADGEKRVEMPSLPNFVSRAGHGALCERNGFTLDFTVDLTDKNNSTVLVDTMTDDGRGLRVEQSSNGLIQITMSDGSTVNSWECDCEVLRTGLNQVGIIVDGGPRIISFVINGKFCDGGTHRQFGWGRFSPALKHCNGSAELTIASSVRNLRIYDRALMVSEIIGNQRADKACSSTG